MIGLIRTRWQNLIYGLWFLPGLITALLFGLAVLLVRFDRAARLDGPFVFGGESDAARQILAVIAGSIITVAGVTFSLTIVVLQLVSSQFSPRVLRNFLGDRVTQLTAGAFIGIFVYCLLVLRAVRDDGAGGEEFVPHLGVAVAIGLGLSAFALLLVFIHHMAQSIRVSNLASWIGRDTIRAIERLYPDPYTPAAPENTEDVIGEWEAEGPPGLVFSDHSGFVQKISVEDLVRELHARCVRLYLEICPGDFVTEKTPLAEIWPHEAADEQTALAVSHAVNVADERDMGQDAAFGIRQLADIAMKAMSPAINDPTTAATCIGYMRAAIARLAERALPDEVLGFPDRQIELIARRREFVEFLEAFVEVGRYASRDTRVAAAVLEGLAEIAETAAAAGADARVWQTVRTAETVAGPALEDARTDHDREILDALLDRIERVSRRVTAAEEVAPET